IIANLCSALAVQALQYMCSGILLFICCRLVLTAPRSKPIFVLLSPFKPCNTCARASFYLSVVVLFLHHLYHCQSLFCSGRSSLAIHVLGHPFIYLLSSCSYSTPIKANLCSALAVQALQYMCSGILLFICCRLVLTSPLSLPIFVLLWPFKPCNTCARASFYLSVVVLFLQHPDQSQSLFCSRRSSLAIHVLGHPFIYLLSSCSYITSIIANLCSALAVQALQYMCSGILLFICCRLVLTAPLSMPIFVLLWPFKPCNTCARASFYLSV